MLGNLINFSDPSKNSYYFSFAILIIAIILLIQLIIMNLKKYPVRQNPAPNSSLDNKFPYDKQLLRYRKDVLKSRYLLAFAITRSAMWAKVPYLYALFMILHKFSFAEIGFLFLIYSFIGLFIGPIIYKLANKYGRKLFCLICNFITIIALFLLIQGSRILAYIAVIIVSGFSSRLLSSIFEAWLASESELLLQNLNDERELFRKHILIKSNIYDGLISIITCIICSFIYTYFGITSPFWISIFLSLLSSIYIGIFWNENIIIRLEGEPGNNLLFVALHELKKVDVLCIGLIEGLAMACLKIYIFSWTPILKQSTPGGMNFGFIFSILALGAIIGFKFYEMLIIHLRFDYCISITGTLFLQGLTLFLTYYINSFFWRMIFLSLFNGLLGFYSPLNSIIKSDILIGPYKSIIMALFNIPTNIYIIAIFLHLNYMNCFTLALISSIISVIAFIIGIFLTVYLRITKKNEENLEHEGYNNLLQYDIN